MGLFAQPPKKVYSRVRHLPQAIDTPSAPLATGLHPENGIFRDAHNRGRALGAVVPAHVLALEGLAFYSPISIPLPEALYEVHDLMLPLGLYQQTWPGPTLLVTSTTRGKTVSHMTLQRERRRKSLC
jgi:hypothetical protein